MTPREWRHAGGMAAVVAGLHVVGFGILILVVAPQKYGLGSAGTFTVGVGFTAYTLGLRHAFDADHISAIDNTTRKFMAEGQRPLSVGFFFSLGHSTIVFALAFLIGLGIKTLDNPVKNDQSVLHKTTNIIGTGVSGFFLYIIAILNLIILISILRIFRDMKRGKYNEQQLEKELNSRGLMNRLFGKHLNKIKKPWQMYPVGVLFGLGFDTATEVALLVIAGSAGAAGLPFYAIICLPILFAAGMSLLDTIDGSFMNFAYGWAFSKPVRKVYYNIAVTGLSVVVALFIGTIELLGLLLQKLNVNGSVSDFFQNFNINTAGFVIVGMFAATWVIALAVWRFGHIEERWTAGMTKAQLANAAANPGELAALEGDRSRL
ncbi:MAG: HoxN/HupN/NixA family nickel/cobalt transporter [Solirubrobacteraceae bacterium]